MRAGLIAGLSLALLGASAAPCIAQDAPTPDPVAAPPGGWPEAYPRFRAQEYGLTLGLLAGLTATTLLMPTPPRGWKEGWLFDDAARDVLRASTRDQQERLSTVSDVLQNIALLTPVLIDLGVGALLYKQDLDVALQMALIDAEVFMLATSMVVLTKRTVGRVRPNIPECGDGGYACHSNSSRRAFLSGHSTAAFAAAGLSCVHHQQLALFGGGLADDMMCAAMVGVAGAATVLRVAADKHWATDTLLGATTGLLSGYLFPYLTHYQGEVHWPGMYDDELDGSLVLEGLVGPLYSERSLGLTGGVGLSARLLYNAQSPLRAELTSQGRLMYDSQGFAVRDLLGEVRLWWGPVALGAALLFRSLQSEATDAVHRAAGATLSFGTFSEDHPWLLSLRWLPGWQGALGDFSARMQWAPFRHLTLSLEGQSLSAAPASGPVQGASAVLGVGGRLPW